MEMSSGAHRDLGEPIAYLVLETGGPVLAAGGEEVGTLSRVLAAPQQDVFDGLVLDTPDGLRFVDADHVEALYERGVVLTLGAEEVRRLPDPTQDTDVAPVSPEELEGGLSGAIHRAWQRISGRY